jgi:hypothetical protein
MFVLDKDGNVREGILLTDQEKTVRDQLVKLLHEKICGSYTVHSDYSRRSEGIPKCETCANVFITKFKLEPREDIDLEREIEVAARANAPQESEAPQAA